MQLAVGAQHRLHLCWSGVCLACWIDEVHFKSAQPATLHFQTCVIVLGFTQEKGPQAHRVVVHSTPWGFSSSRDQTTLLSGSSTV